MKKMRFASGMTAWAVILSAAVPLIQPFAAVSASAEPAAVSGDVNGDGAFTVKDAVLLQQWLVNPNAVTIDLQQADLVSNDKVNVYDLRRMKQLLHQKPEPSEPSENDYSHLKINEVCTSNQDSFHDAAGLAPDWIELYNAGDAAIDLGGVGLSDGKKNRYKFTFPQGTVLGADSYILVLCDDTDSITETEYHAAFKLSASGETIYLTAPMDAEGNDGEEIDMVTVPALETDYTYGRYQNGTDTFATLLPSPAQNNDTATVIYEVSAPVFSQEAGFFEQGFDLTLAHENTSAVELLYTTDGSDPRTSNTAKSYTNAIKIYDSTSQPNVWSAITDISLYGYKAPRNPVDKGMIIRAVCKDAQGNFSDVITNGYYINKTAAYYKDLKVISIATDSDNFFSNDTGIYMIGKKYHEWKAQNPFSMLPEYSTDNPTNYNQSGKDWERPVNIQVYENGALAYTENVGIRISGNATRSQAQKSMTLYARSDYGASKMKYDFFGGKATDIEGNVIKSFDKVTLRNGGNDYEYARFRDDLNQWCAEGLDVSTQTKGDYIVFLDGEFWGYYSLQERYDENYVASHYNVKSDNVTTIKIGEAEGSETVAQEYEDFMQWVQNADLSRPENYQRVCDTIDIQSLMDYVTVETYICNWDWIENNNNWMLWRVNEPVEGNEYADGKWRYMLYDTEYSDGIYGDVKTRYSYDALAIANKKYKADNALSVFSILMNNAEFKEQFYQNYLRIMQQNFDAAKIREKINDYRTRLESAYLATFQRFGINAKNYQTNTEEVENFFNNRGNAAKRYLDAICNDSGAPVQPSGSGCEIEDPFAWSLWTDDCEGYMEKSLDGTITIVTEQLGRYEYAMQAAYSGLKLERGKTYRLTYTAQSAGGYHNYAVGVQKNGGNYDTYLWKQQQVTPNPQTFTETFRMKDDCFDATLYFGCGRQTGTFIFSNISLECIG